MTRHPDDLLTPLGRPGRAEEIMLHPNARALMVVDTAPEPRQSPPEEPTDTIGFDIGRHRLGWRILGRDCHSRNESGHDEASECTAIISPAVALDVHFVLDGSEFGSLTPRRLAEPQFHQSPSNPVLKYWDVDDSCRLSSLIRRQRSLVPGRARESEVRCYDLQWGTERWLMAMVDFPKSFGLWRIEQSDRSQAGDGVDKIISGDPIASYTRRGLKTPAHLTWTTEARLLDVIICATRGYHGDFTQLASTKAQIAYSVAAGLSF